MKNNTQKTVLVTGGAGFIGSHLCDRLLNMPEIEKVVCVDNLDPVYPVSLKKENISVFSGNSKFVFYENDICDLSAMRDIFEKEKPDYVINLAAKTDTRASVMEPYEHVRVNIIGVLNILELSKDFRVKRVSLFSSSSVYGNSKATPPFAETESTDFPLAPYGATKKAAEVLAYTYFYNHNLPVFCFRLFNVYGERMRPGPVLSKWTENIFLGKPIELSSTKAIRRDFTYVEDVVDALVRSTDENIAGYHILNIASSNPASLVELLNIVEKVSGVKAEVIHRESNKASIEVSHADITKAKEILGWEPKTTLEDGVSRYIEWFKKNRLSSN